MRDIDTAKPMELLAEAENLVSYIPNTEDRIGRLDALAKGYEKLQNGDKAAQLIRLATKMAQSLEGLGRDKILASVIQTAHQIDASLAAQLTETVENESQKRAIDASIKSKVIARNPGMVHNQLDTF